MKLEIDRVIESIRIKYDDNFTSSNIIRALKDAYDMGASAAGAAECKRRAAMGDDLLTTVILDVWLDDDCIAALDSFNVKWRDSDCLSGGGRYIEVTGAASEIHKVLAWYNGDATDHVVHLHDVLIDNPA